MCGIAGILYRNQENYRHLGTDLLKLIEPLESRGPDSCGVGLFSGQQLAIHKNIGSAAYLFDKYGLTSFSGSHGIAHTRMATESVVNVDHSHPFTSGADFCIVHNGQISNYYKLRFFLERLGMVFATNNDSEAIAHFLRYQFLQGKSLEMAFEALLAEFDGTYTVLVATPYQIGLVRDKYAAKPAVVYESETLVAISSEYRCLLRLSGYSAEGSVREPDAGEVNVWSVEEGRVRETPPSDDGASSNFVRVSPRMHGS